MSMHESEIGEYIESKLIRKVTSTSANVYDSMQEEKLNSHDEKDLFGGKNICKVNTKIWSAIMAGNTVCWAMRNDISHCLTQRRSKTANIVQKRNRRATICVVEDKGQSVKNAGHKPNAYLRVIPVCLHRMIRSNAKQNLNRAAFFLKKSKPVE